MDQVFVVGSYYKITHKPADVGEPPGYVPYMDKIKGIPLKCVRVYEHSGFAVLEHEDGCWCYSPKWVEPAQDPNTDKPSAPNTCQCLLMAGCSCGRMKADMAARGLIKDPLTGLWVKEKEAESQPKKREIKAKWSLDPIRPVNGLFYGIAKIVPLQQNQIPLGRVNRFWGKDGETFYS